MSNDRPGSVLALDLNVEEAKAELALPEPEPSTELQTRAETQVEQLVTLDPTDQASRDAARAAVDGMGRDLQQRSASRSRLLQEPLKDLSHASEDGGPSPSRCPTSASRWRSSTRRVSTWRPAGSRGWWGCSPGSGRR